MSGDAGGVQRLAIRLIDEPPRGVRDTAGFVSAISLAMDNASLPKDPITRTFRSDSDDGVVSIVEPDMLAQSFLFNGPLQQHLAALIAERAVTDDLALFGLEPSSKVLLSGPPGVGKTASAHWLAGHLGLPLVVLDLAQSMSSYLGESGRNIQAAFERAKATPAVFLIDEFDALAKRRDDSSDLGELKRLVNVLLLELDNWDSQSLLVAATNHSQLLDPAVQRRFDLAIEIPLPDVVEVHRLVVSTFGPHAPDDTLAAIVAEALLSYSNSDVVRFCRSVYRAAIVSGREVTQVLLERIAAMPKLSKDAEAVVWLRLTDELNMTSRAIADIANVSHPTVSNRIKKARELHGRTL